MRPLHIIMPMAGEGSRFLAGGWDTPKPLIELHGKTLFEHALSSIDIDVPKKYSFIVRQEHIDKYRIDEKIKAILPCANVFSVSKTTRGAVETCLIAREAIAEEDAVLVMDCDLEFRSKTYTEKIKEILSKKPGEVDGGVLISFDANDSRYSYAAVDDKYNVVRTAEKQVISRHALCGAYFFSTSAAFLYAATALMQEAEFSHPEFYVSLLYNYLLQRGERVTLTKTDEYYSYGTPEELGKHL